MILDRIATALERIATALEERRSPTISYQVAQTFEPDLHHVGTTITKCISCGNWHGTNSQCPAMVAR